MTVTLLVAAVILAVIVLTVVAAAVGPRRVAPRRPARHPPPLIAHGTHKRTRIHRHSATHIQGGPMATTPPDRPFQHTAECRTTDAQLEWEKVGELHFRRLCSCHEEHYYADPVKPPAPDPAVFTHGVDEDGEPCGASVKPEWRDGMWQLRCKTCGTGQYFWQDHLGLQPDGTPVPLPVGTRLVEAAR